MGVLKHSNGVNNGVNNGCYGFLLRHSVVKYKLLTIFKCMHGSSKCLDATVRLSLVKHNDTVLSSKQCTYNEQLR